MPCWRPAFHAPNCGLTGLGRELIIFTNGKELLVRQRAKVGRIKLADFFVPLVGNASPSGIV
jgi:hypothetical protein